MGNILINLDNATLSALNRVAPPGERKRTEFLRKAVRAAVMQELENRTRAAYLAQPDSEEEADDWSNPEAFKP